MKWRVGVTEVLKVMQLLWLQKQSCSQRVDRSVAPLGIVSMFQRKATASETRVGPVGLTRS